MLGVGCAGDQNRILREAILNDAFDALVLRELIVVRIAAGRRLAIVQVQSFDFFGQIVDVLTNCLTQLASALQ